MDRAFIINHIIFAVLAGSCAILHSLQILNVFLQTVVLYRTRTSQQPSARASTSNGHHSSASYVQRSGEDSTPRAGQLHRDMAITNVFVVVLLALLSVDPLAVLGILSHTALVFFYMNGGAQVSVGMGILILRTMQVYSSVNTTLGKPVISERMQTITRTLTIILLFIVPIAAANTFAAITAYTNRAWPEGGFLAVMAGSLLGALLVFNTFCNSLRKTVSQFTDTGAPIGTAIIERLRGMMFRLVTLQVVSSVLDAIAIVALVYVATHCFNEHDWPWADPAKWDGRAWRLTVLGYLELSAFWVDLWYNWLPLFGPFGLFSCCRGNSVKKTALAAQVHGLADDEHEYARATEIDETASVSTDTSSLHL